MMEKEKQIEELAEILRKVCDATPNGKCMSKLCCVCRDETVIEAGYHKQSEWISVEERLPSSEDLERSQFHNFLVANEFGEVREAVFTGKYFTKLGSRLNGVTHWMPLPEPPEMKGV